MIDILQIQKTGNLYSILEVNKKASDEVIHGAYKALMLKFRPDVRNENKDIGIKLNFAKEILLDKTKRKEYDDFILENENKKTLGNYKILEQIGQGGFGRTYKAEHIFLNEFACLKQNLEITPQDTELITKEAKVLWNIHHHSLPTLREFFKAQDGSCVLAMSYIEGKSLDKIVEKTKILDPEHVAWITQRLLNALHYLHFYGIVHCDVKPQNIIVKPKEHNAVLVDYGFACLAPNRKTMPEGYTPAFAAPELLACRPPIPETDLYSLGASMIYALGGDPISKTYPKGVPSEIRTFYDSLVLYDPRQRPNWDKTDLIKDFSNLREKVFGRRQSINDLIV